MIQVLRHYLWVVPLFMGLTFIGGGAFMFVEGNAAKNDVKEAIVGERITTSADASIPGVPVNSAETAQAQADAIEGHVLAQTGGKTYSELSSKIPEEATLRATYLNSVTLRTALNLAVMGFKVSDLVMGMGAFMVALGLTHAFVLAPVLFWTRETAAERATVTAKAPALAPSAIAQGR